MRVNASEEPLLGGSSRKALSAVEGRGLVVVILSLLFATVLTSIPTVFYVWDPTSETSEQEAITCHNSQAISVKELIGSQCSSALHWKYSPPGYRDKRNVSVLKCSFRDTEDDVQAVFQLLANVKSNREIQRCLTNAIPLICHVVYRDCDVSGQLPTRQHCLDVKNNFCKDYWDFVAELLRVTKGIGRCLALPDCEKDFPQDRSSRPTRSISLPSKQSAYSLDVMSNKTSVNCTEPLIPTQIANPRFPLECSPRCLEDGWASASEREALDIILDLTAVVSWICCVITFITWAGVPTLRRFPQITPLFLIMSYTISVVGLSLPVVLGRYRAYCSHEDILSVMVDPSTVCKVQGILIHFGFMSTTVWWLCCIFNVFILVCSNPLSNVILDHPRALFTIEFLASVILPACLVGIVMGIGGGYSTYSVQVVLCSPPTRELFYFTFSLPLQIMIFAGSILMAVVILRLRKARAFRESCNTRIVSHAHKAIEKRFLLVIIVFPLCIGTILTTISVYDAMLPEMIVSYLEYAFCLDRGSQKQTCSSGTEKYHSVITSIVDLILLDIFNVVLMVSTLLPKPARQFWRRGLAKIARCHRNVPDDSEAIEQNAQLHPPIDYRPSGRSGSCSGNTQ